MSPWPSKSFLEDSLFCFIFLGLADRILAGFVLLISIMDTASHYTFLIQQLGELKELTWTHLAVTL